jgi:7-cyano-7-deazaguanine synthase
VLASGGLDSAVLLWESLRRYRAVTPLYIRAGLRWEAAEIVRLRRFLRRIRSRPFGSRRVTPPNPGRLQPLEIVSLPMADLYGRHWSTTGRAPAYDGGAASVYLPGRNITLFAKGATFCALRGIPTLVSGVLRGNPYPDATPAFLRAIQRALSRGLDTPIRIRTPFRLLGKDRVVRRGRHLPLHLTISCSNPRRGRHCGDCSKCAERVEAFRRAGLRDRTDYAGGPGSAASRPGSGPAAVVPGARTTRAAAKKAASDR